jgi:hypothetical protein
MAGEQIAQDLRIDTSMRQSRVEPSPSAPVRGLEAQVDRRRGGIRTEDGVGELEESVGSVVEAFVERVAEAVERIGRLHVAPIMHSQRAFRTPYLPAELERKLRDRQAPIFRCRFQRAQATRLAPASTTPAVAVPMMTPARTSKGKWTPR